MLSGLFDVIILLVHQKKVCDKYLTKFFMYEWKNMPVFFIFLEELVLRNSLV
jgi:hypothetical protein